MAAIDPARRWQRVRRPIQAMAATLLDHGWSSHTSALWTAPNGDDYELTDEANDDRFFEQVWKRHAVDKQWAEAAKHHLGQGLGGGAHVFFLRSAVRRLRNKGKLQEAQLMLTIAAGGLWTGSRCWAAGYPVECCCPLCGATQTLSMPGHTTAQS